MDNDVLLAHYGKSILQYVDHPVLQAHRKLLNKFIADRIFCIFYSEEEGFTIDECCDDYFTHCLTKDECIELAQLFTEIAQSITN